MSYTDTASTPETTGYDYVDSCTDETENIVPYYSKTVGSTTAVTDEVADIGTLNGLFKWTLNSTSMLVSWTNPTLLQVMNGESAFEVDDSVLELPDANVWVYLAIETDLPVPHP